MIVWIQDREHHICLTFIVSQQLNVPQEEVHIDPESALDYVGDGLFTEAELNYTNSNDTLAEIQKV